MILNVVNHVPWNVRSNIANWIIHHFLRWILECICFNLTKFITFLVFYVSWSCDENSDKQKCPLEILKDVLQFLKSIEKVSYATFWDILDICDDVLKISFRNLKNILCNKYLKNIFCKMSFRHLEIPWRYL